MKKFSKKCKNQRTGQKTPGSPPNSTRYRPLKKNLPAAPLRSLSGNRRSPAYLPASQGRRSRSHKPSLPDPCLDSQIGANALYSRTFRPACPARRPSPDRFGDVARKKRHFKDVRGTIVRSDDPPHQGSASSGGRAALACLRQPPVLEAIYGASRDDLPAVDDAAFVAAQKFAEPVGVD